jgi:two-component SAPR family response regulator
MNLNSNTEMNISFIIIDDDYVSNLICRKIVKHVLPEVNLQSFTNPEEALAYIKSFYAYPCKNKTILLLDINMPILSGWDFIERFENFDTYIKEQLKIYMLSSSIDQCDKDNAVKNKNVCGYIEKPLTIEIIEKIVFSKPDIF